jgi:hypothetical protein
MKFYAMLGLVLATAIPAAADDCGVPGWILSGDNPQGYSCGTELVAGTSVKSAFIKAKDERPQGIATLMQQIAADPYRGQRLSLSADIKTLDAATAYLWLRVDGPNHDILKFYNMEDRPVTGTTDWKLYTVVLDVPPEGAVISFGFFLRGHGEAWAKGFSLVPVGKDVPVSVMPSSPPPKTPANLDFDQ